MQSDKISALQEQIDKNLQTLRTLRDELRVRAHLFSMDAKKAWKELEPKIQHAEAAAKKATEASATALGSMVQALIDFRKTLTE